MLSSISTVQSFKTNNIVLNSLLSNYLGLPVPTLYIPIREYSIANYSSGVQDLSGITAYNDPSFNNTGAVGTRQSLNFIRSLSQYVQLPNINMSTLNSFTVSLWFKVPSNVANYTNIWCISNYLYSGGDIMPKYTWALFNIANEIRFEYARDGSVGTVRKGKNVSINYNVWCHAVLIQRVDLSIDIYLNNVKSTYTMDGINIATDQNFNWNGIYNMIGRSSYLSDPYTSMDFDDYRFYSNIELTDSEITKLYNTKNVTSDVIN